MSVLKAHVATKATFIGVQDAPHVLVPLHSNGVVLEALARMEVHHKEQITTLEGNDLVTLVLEHHILVFRRKPGETALRCLHQLVKSLEEVVAQVILVCEIPAAAAVVVTPAILRPREVNPLWVSKLIAHEVQVALTTKAEHQETNHLVQSQATVNAHRGSRALNQAHTCVHLGIHEPESNGLVTDNGLVVRLHVCHALLLPPSVGQGVCDPAHVPGIIGALL
mmetsp:Transcript_61777/g.147378  ORF Transcript_61777/g.147378 Transcript_61777/m.147378 type:complete len:223 (+) Transcript_61777:4157-4825(+)